jgi:hypothetical protein
LRCKQERLLRIAHASAPLSRGTPPQASGSPAPGADAPRCTNRRHNDQKTELRRVYYPWHPWFEKTVCVTVELRTRVGAVARCQPSDGDGRQDFQLPQWMLDAERCAAMRQEEHPRVSWQALLELRRLLDELIAAGVVQGRRRPSQGDADEPSTSPATAAPAEPVRPTTAATPLGGAAAGQPSGGPSHSGPDAPRARTPAQRSSHRKGGDA